MINIYSAFFIGAKKHVTWEFNPGHCSLPAGANEGEEVVVKVVGEYRDSQISALHVEVILADGTVLTHQPSGTPLHITVKADGVPPVESGLRIKKFGANPVRPYHIKAKAGFFKAPPRS